MSSTRYATHGHRIDVERPAKSVEITFSTAEYEAGWATVPDGQQKSARLPEMEYSRCQGLSYTG
jgi:hypothetical protein